MIKIGDGIMVVLAVLVIGFIAWQFYGVTDGAMQLEVQSVEGRFLYPLDTQRQIVVAGPIGESHIEIGEHGAHFVTPAPCKDKIGILSGFINEINAWAACLPNKVLIRVIGKDENADVDGIAS